MSHLPKCNWRGPHFERIKLCANKLVIILVSKIVAVVSNDPLFPILFPQKTLMRPTSEEERHMQIARNISKRVGIPKRFFVNYTILEPFINGRSSSIAHVRSAIFPRSIAWWVFVWGACSTAFSLLFFVRRLCGGYLGSKTKPHQFNIRPRLICSLRLKSFVSEHWLPFFGP